jgi:hypothetical protein
LPGFGFLWCPFISCLQACSSERCFGSFEHSGLGRNIRAVKSNVSRRRQKDFCASCFRKHPGQSAGTDSCRELVLNDLGWLRGAIIATCTRSATKE